MATSILLPAASNYHHNRDIAVVAQWSVALNSLAKNRSQDSGGSLLQCDYGVPFKITGRLAVIGHFVAVRCDMLTHGKKTGMGFRPVTLCGSIEGYAKLLDKSAPKAEVRCDYTDMHSACKLRSVGDLWAICGRSVGG